ncbi:MAG: flagellar hook capping FlgD N-terminal domain-containing protein, partial [Candidatus Wallbacteria bacterium]|nr:flagellar hook capping FlgD N-terminal domain-containing protein [Candidatus Wallbacteria bacterium]
IAQAQSEYLMQQMENYGAETSSTRTLNNTMGKDAFLQLLIAEMKNQDPLSPMSNTDFVAQTAQFTSLEQLTNLNTGFQELSAALNNYISSNDQSRILRDNLSLLDRVVSGTTESGEFFKGQVTGIQYDESAQDLKLTIYNDGRTADVYLSMVERLETA